MSKFDVSKFKLSFDKPRKQKPTEEQAQETVDKPAEAAKKRWWQLGNMGMNIGSNKEGVSKKKY
jgi:hypothetical protein